MTDSKSNKYIGRFQKLMGLVVAAALISLFLRHFDLAPFFLILQNANLSSLAFLPLLILSENAIKAFKWKKMLPHFKLTSTSLLFQAIMAGSFSNYFAFFRASPFVRAWIVSRKEQLSFSMILASTTSDRAVDASVFVVFSLPILIYSAGQHEAMRNVLGTLPAVKLPMVLAFVSLCVFSCAIIACILKIHSLRIRIWNQLLNALPGLNWPRSSLKLLLVCILALIIKFIGIVYLFYSCRTYGANLSFTNTTLLFIGLSFYGLFAGILRIAGGYTTGAILIFGIFGISLEKATAIMLTSQCVVFISTALIGGRALNKFGLNFKMIKKMFKEMRRKEDAALPNQK